MQLVLGQLFGQSPKVLLSIALTVYRCIFAAASSLFMVEHSTISLQSHCLLCVKTLACNPYTFSA